MIFKREQWSASQCDLTKVIIPGLERSPGEGNGYPLLYYYLENSMGRGAWRATVLGITKSQIWLNDWTELFFGRKPMTNLDSMLKSLDIALPTEVHIFKAMVFPVVMYGCKGWVIKKAGHWRIDTFELWCWRNSWESLEQQGDQTSQP